MSTATAFWLPSGSGIPVIAKYETFLIFASNSFTTSFTGAFSATLSFSIAPLRVYGVGEDGVIAFPADGIECLKQIIADEWAAQAAAPARSTMCYRDRRSRLAEIPTHFQTAKPAP
jgi:hypothetical protein